MERQRRQGLWQDLQVSLVLSGKKLLGQVGAQVPR
jgi:hypothetical protein